MSSPVGRLPGNILSSGVGFLLRFIIAFLFVPFITGVLGEARYGVWILVFQIVNYFFLFDVGMERALSRYLPRFLGLDDFESLNRVLNSATFIYTLAGAATLIAAAVSAWLIMPLFAIDDPLLLREGQLSLVIVGLFAAIRFVAFPFGGSLGALHRFDIAKGLEMGEEIGKTGVFVILLLNGYGLVSLAITMVVFGLLKNLLGLWFLKRLHPEVRVSPRFVDRKTMATMFVFSRTAFAVAVAWLLIYNSDAIVLGLFVSTAAVGIYAPGAQVLGYARQLITALSAPLTPAIAHLESIDSLESVRRIYVKGLTYAAYTGVLVAVCIIAYGRPFARLWLPEEFADAGLVMFILAIGASVFLPQIVSNAVLFAIEKHRHLLWILIVELLLKVGLAVALLLGVTEYNAIESDMDLKKLSLILMASAAAFPQIVLSLTAYPAVMSRVLRLRLRTIWHTFLVAGALAAAIVGPLAHSMKILWCPDSWAAFAVHGGVLVLSWAAGLYLLVLEPEDRRRLRQFVRLS